MIEAIVTIAIIVTIAAIVTIAIIVARMVVVKITATVAVLGDHFTATLEVLSDIVECKAQWKCQIYS